MNIALLLCMATLCSSCDKELIEYQQNDLKVSIEQGEAYLHDFPLFMGIKKKNPGHSSPDGTDGNLRTDVSKLTSALDIIKQITINIQ